MKRLIVIFTVFSLFSCSNRQAQTESVENQISQKTEEKVVRSEKQVERVVHSEKQDKKVEVKQIKLEDDSAFVNGSIGLLFIDVFSGSELIIKNEDNSIFASFDFSQEESQSFYDMLDSVVLDFKLFAYKPDYNLLAFQCNLTDSNYVINTISGESKLITRDNANYNFLTWAEFILSDRYVSLKGTYNDFYDTPLKFFELPNDTANYIQFERYMGLIFINALEIKNEWVKIVRECDDNDTIKPFIGWTKWKEKDKLSVDFWFLL